MEGIYVRLPNLEEARKRDKIDYKTIDYKLDNKLKNKFNGKKYFLKTYGCQMNEHDSENMIAMLRFMSVITYIISNTDIIMI